MSRARQERLINAILYGSVAAVLIFFYIPIFTLIAFSFQEGRYLIRWPCFSGWPAQYNPVPLADSSCT